MLEQPRADAAPPFANKSSEDWRRDHLPGVANELRSRPQHEKVRALLHEVLVRGLHVPSGDIRYEHRVPRVRGRMDALLGNVVIEIKSNLDAEADDVAARLPDYLAEAERESGRRFLGIATDGLVWEAHELRDGRLVRLDRFELPADRPAALLGWLEPVFTTRDDLVPDAPTIARHLGAGSLAWQRARRDLEALWAELREHPEVALKRRLWADLLGQAQGEEEQGPAADALFLQHTYLVVVAKTIAAHVLEITPADAEAALSGAPLADMGITGAVEADFFDWVLRSAAGATLVMRLLRHTARLRLRAVGDDVMKRVYESLIPREERYRLGEYYTPDWLASRVVRAAVQEPLTQRVLDPSCGSGTFLFHAVRHFLAAAETAGWDDRRAVAGCVNRVQGLDVHPVAVILARVTWLLAVGVEKLRARPPVFSVPVFLGDALQVNVRNVVGERELAVPVPGEARPLLIPGSLTEDQARFDHIVSEMTRMVEEGAPAATFKAWIKRQGAEEAERNALADTYGRLDALNRAGRNHVWGFVLRNLSQPLRLSRAEHRVDVLLGNPPWLPFRGMAPAVKRDVKAMCEARGLWAGGKLATQQDLSALFLVRAAELYLKPGGSVAMVMPYAVLNRPAYKGLRDGACRTVSLRLIAAWAMRNDVRPLFPTSSCVVFARRELPGPLPATVTALAGTLAVRDAREAEAAGAISAAEAPWPPAPRFGESHYRKLFVQGATVVPRRFFLVERRDAGPLGANPDEPLLRGRTGALDKAPWRDLPPPEGRVERVFVRPLLLGESIAPFRVVAPVEAVIPVPPDGRAPLDAAGAAREGWRRLAGWLEQCEAKWAQHAARGADGKPRVTLNANLDNFGKLSAQFPPKPLRVVYAASGTLMTAVLVRDPAAIIEHVLYYYPARSEAEAYYLLALLNADGLRRRITAMQAQGWQDPRHFDKLVFEQPIPEFDRRDPLHAELADAARRAEAMAAAVPLKEGAYFQQHRKAIRAALAAGGFAAELDALAERLLPAP